MNIEDRRRKFTHVLTAPLAVGAVLLTASCASDSDTNGNDSEPEGANQTQADTSPESAEGEDDASDESDASDDGGPYSFTQVEANNTADSCWAVIDQTVYDLTDWIDEHPGGADRIEQLCGTDATDQFTAQHGGSSGPEERLTSFEIGPLTE